MRLDAERVRALDPLGAEAALARLPRLNRASDLRGLITALRGLIPEARARATLVADPNAACAAMRDLGMFLGSIRRLGAQPVAAMPELEPLLRALGHATAMIPRDTVLHYGPWNPTGDRRRMYVGDPNEASLIECVATSAPALDEAIDALIELAHVSPAEEDFFTIAEHVASRVTRLVDVIDYARRCVDPIFFAQVLRPYFEPIDVAGATWQGPAAAHIPLYLVDHLVWSSDVSDPDVRALHEDTAFYGLPRWRAIYRARANRPSLLRHVSAAMPTIPVEKRDALRRALHAIVRPLVVFRGRHIAIANLAYAPDVRQFATGSGGYAVETLSHVLRVLRTRFADFSAETGSAEPVSPPSLPRRGTR